MHQSYLCGYKTRGMGGWTWARWPFGPSRRATSRPIRYIKLRGGGIVLLFKWTMLPLATSPLYASFLILPSFIHLVLSLCSFLWTLSSLVSASRNPITIGHPTSHTGRIKVCCFKCPRKTGHCAEIAFKWFTLLLFIEALSTAYRDSNETEKWSWWVGAC